MDWGSNEFTTVMLDLVTDYWLLDADLRKRCLYRRSLDVAPQRNGQQELEGGGPGTQFRSGVDTGIKWVHYR